MKRLHLVDVGVGAAIIVLALAVVFKVGEWSPSLPHATPTADEVIAPEFAALFLSTPTPVCIPESDLVQASVANDAWHLVETTKYRDPCSLAVDLTYFECLIGRNIRSGYYNPGAGGWRSDEVRSGPYDTQRECEDALSAQQANP